LRQLRRGVERQEAQHGSGEKSPHWAPHVRTAAQKQSRCFGSG
jgi:hypothetical protein